MAVVAVKLRSVLAMPLAQVRAGGGREARGARREEAGGPWEVPLVTSRPWRRSRDVRRRDIATSLGGGGLSIAPPVRQRVARAATPLPPDLRPTACEWVRVQWVQCARPHEDPAERARTVWRVPRSDPGVARRSSGSRQASARSAPARRYAYASFQFCVYFRFRCVEPLGA